MTDLADLQRRVLVKQIGHSNVTPVRSRMGARDAAAYRQFVELLVPLVRGCWNPPSPLVPSISRDYRRTEKPHQRDRECLEPGKAAYAPLQRHTESPLLFVSQRV